MTRVLAGVFVGGASKRMGGRPKGLLPTREGTSIVERWRLLLDSMGVEVVLAGDASAYASLGLCCVHDDPTGIGPLGGLVALLRRAEGRRVLAVACDMPFVTRALAERLVQAPDAPAVAPKRAGRWEPLFARYDAARVLPAAVARARSGDRSLKRLLEDVGAAELPLLGEEEQRLDDWDRPEDVGRSHYRAASVSANAGPSPSRR